MPIIPIFVHVFEMSICMSSFPEFYVVYLIIILTVVDIPRLRQSVETNNLLLINILGL
jgi:hypothetical protein